MKTIGLGAKLRDCCEAGAMSFDDFVADFEGASHVSRVTIKTWSKIAEGDKVALRAAGQELLGYWRQRGLNLTETDFGLSRKAFRKKLGLSDLPELTEIPPHWATLTGVYQIIRPNADSDQAFIFEGMQIVIEGNIVKTMFYSSDHTDPKYLYGGAAIPAERYFFTLLDRQHETYADRRAFRAVAFYVAENFDRSCLTGLMIRGMSGTNSDKGLASLPFIAIALAGEIPLKDNQNILLKKPRKGANNLVVSRRGGSLILGDAWKQDYPELFEFGDRIFNDPTVLDSIQRAPLRLRTIAPKILKNAAVADAEAWAETVAKLALDDTTP